MPSSNYLTNYYKKLFPRYSYKIFTNQMPIETDNSLSNLKNEYGAGLRHLLQFGTNNFFLHFFIKPHFNYF